MKKMGQAVTIKSEDNDTRGWFFVPLDPPHRARSLAERDTFELLARGESIHAL